jgi:serine/threonine-protein kinase RsbW
LIETVEERMRLPQAVSVTRVGSDERVGIVARLFAVDAFEGAIYADKNQVRWVIALVSSNEPLDLETLGRIERRLDAAARGAEGIIVRWYISKEGFSAAASSRLAELGAHHSTYLHLDLLTEHLAAVGSGSETGPASEFELIIPIEEESELIAARTAEQIARAASFDQQSINQIKTAIIEACLNAAEHGDSPDRRIYNRFAVTEDRLSIRVSNRGKQLAATGNGKDREAGSKGRGRGLQIIRALMDEVRFERDPSGTTLVMVKLLKSSRSPTET